MDPTSAEHEIASVPCHIVVMYLRCEKRNGTHLDSSLEPKLHLKKPSQMTMTASGIPIST